MLIISFLHLLASIMSPMIDKSSDLFFQSHFISLDPNIYYSCFSDYRDYKANVSTYLSTIPPASYFLESKLVVQQCKIITFLLVIGRSYIYRNNQLDEQIPVLALVLSYNEAYMNK